MYDSVKDSGERQAFSTGAVRDKQTGKGRYDLLPAHAIERLARHFENGAVKYGDENWRKGIPLRRYVDSAIRHLFKFLEGQRDEDHAIAAAWNLLALVETQAMIERGILPMSLDNLPSYIGEADDVEEEVSFSGPDAFADPLEHYFDRQGNAVYETKPTPTPTPFSEAPIVADLTGWPDVPLSTLNADSMVLMVRNRLRERRSDPSFIMRMVRWILEN